MASSRTYVPPPAKPPGDTGRKAVGVEVLNPTGSTPVRSTRVLATIAPQPKGTTSAHRQCEHCQGQVLGETWVHDARCPYTVVLWFGLSHRASDWTSPIYACCPYRCPGTVLPSAVIHSWDCSFWDSEYNHLQQTPLFAREPYEIAGDETPDGER